MEGSVVARLIATREFAIVRHIHSDNRKTGLPLAFFATQTLPRPVDALDVMSAHGTVKPKARQLK